MSLFQNYNIHKDYLIINYPKNDSCLKECLDYYGLIIDIVKNYKDVIEKITSKNVFGKCPYYVRSSVALPQPGPGFCKVPTFKNTQYYPR